MRHKSNGGPGPDVTRISTARLRRLIDVSRLIEQGISSRDIQLRLRLSRKMLEFDRASLEQSGLAAIRQTLADRGAPPGDGRRACPMMWLGPDGVETCGTLSDQQYCPEHRAQTVIGAGPRPAGPRALLGIGGRV